MLDVKKVAQEKNGTSKNYKKRKKKKRKKRLKKKSKERKKRKEKNGSARRMSNGMRGKNINKRKGNTFSCLLKSAIMKCLCTGDQLRWIDEMATHGLRRTRRRGPTSSEVTEETHQFSLEQTEATVCEASQLDQEEARALLGRMEFMNGHSAAAASLFGAIDFRASIPEMKATLSSLRGDPQNQHRQQSNEPPMQLSAVILRIEALYLYSMALHDLGRFKNAAEECSMILDITESALPIRTSAGSGSGSGSSSANQNKLHEIVTMAVEFLPELHMLAGSVEEAIYAYRRALLKNWNLQPAAVTSIQKDFAVALLYGGYEAKPPNIRYQIGGSFVPSNNLEEAIILLVILLRKCNTKQITWDPSVLQHLTFAMSMSSQLEYLAREYEEIPPSLLEKKERLYSLALCYFNEDNDETALHLLKQVVDSKEAGSGGSLDPVILKSLLLASKFCSNKTELAKAAVDYAKRAVLGSRKKTSDVPSIGKYLLGISLSTQAMSTSSDSERDKLQKDALEALQTAEKYTGGNDYNVLHTLALEYAEQRKLHEALKYAKRVVKLKLGSDLNAWILLARILSAQKKYTEAVSAVDSGLDESDKCDHLGLLRTKAKIYTSQGQFKNAVETYTQIFAVLQLKTKSFSAGMEILKGKEEDRTIEIEIWYDLALVYLSMKQSKDVELCLSKIKAINSHSSLYYHATGELHEIRGFLEGAIGEYNKALDIDPTHVPSIVSLAILLRKTGDRPLPVVKNLLTDALRLDRTNYVAWFQLGLLHEAKGGAASVLEAAECFQAAARLEETAPVEPFR